jgi:hypothetical protein
MITIKEWNSLSDLTRKRIVGIVFSNYPSDFKEDLSKPFHHKFSYIATGWGDGATYELMLSHLVKNKNLIKVEINIPIE